MRGSSSVVERFLAKEKVGGSIPLCRSRENELSLRLSSFSLFSIYFYSLITFMSHYDD